MDGGAARGAAEIEGARSFRGRDVELADEPIRRHLQLRMAGRRLRNQPACLDCHQLIQDRVDLRRVHREVACFRRSPGVALLRQLDGCGAGVAGNCESGDIARRDAGEERFATAAGGGSRPEHERGQRQLQDQHADQDLL